MANQDVSCPHCGAKEGEACTTPTGMPLYRVIHVNGARKRVAVSHQRRAKKSLVMHNFFSDAPGKRIKPTHPAVQSATRLDGGAELLQVQFQDLRKDACK